MVREFAYYTGFVNKPKEEAMNKNLLIVGAGIYGLVAKEKNFDNVM